MSTFVLKMLAVLFMVIDHIGFYFEGMPIVLRCIGRLSYPLFLFCMVWGYHYTRNRPRYLLRLYLMSLFMTGLCWWMDNLFPYEQYNGGYGNHNIFLSMLLVGVCISTIELMAAGDKRGWLLLGGIGFVQLFYFVVPSFLPVLRNVSGDVLTGIVPNLVLNEYGFEFVALGVAMYFLREKRELFCAVYILFCIAQFSSEMLQGGGAIQWIMIFALPLMLRYNRQKGPGLKWFFYVFYPVHSLLLFFLANFVFAAR